MKNLGLITPCYAADTSGVCSMLYELGGMVVVHDASGCNSTYTTHDEPRWTLTKSMIYISAFTELDAVMGNDEKLIADICAAAKDQKPKFIAICGSPMPMMTGVDFDAIALETELRTGIPTIGLHTTGTHSYVQGASEALMEYVKRFSAYSSEKIENGVNILGATPLDFGINTSVSSIERWLMDNNLQPVCCLAMGQLAENISNVGKACANLVISETGISAAEYMKKQFGIPYICGVPIGTNYSRFLAQKLQKRISNQPINDIHRTSKSDTIIIGEGVFSVSLANALHMDLGIQASVISPLTMNKNILASADIALTTEEDIQNEILAKSPKMVIADPLYSPLIPHSVQHIKMPHFAFSGRCFGNKIRDLINRNIEEIFHD